MKTAVIKTGGKQYVAKEGDVLTIEKLKGQGDLQKGDKVSFDEILMIDDGKAVQVGAPHVKGAKVDAEVEEVGKGKKILVMRYKAKSNYRKKNGHRQPFTKVKITKI